MEQGSVGRASDEDLLAKAAASLPPDTVDLIRSLPDQQRQQVLAKLVQAAQVQYIQLSEQAFNFIQVQNAMPGLVIPHQAGSSPC